MKPARLAAGIFVLLAAVLSASAIVSAAPKDVTLRGRAMGTAWTVTIRPDQPIETKALERAISDRLEHLEQQFSTYRTQSELSHFNASAIVHPDWIPVSPEMARVAAESRRISELTRGAFDVTVAPLVRLWGFGPQRRSDNSLPTENEIRSARLSVDWRGLEVRVHQPALRKKSATVQADFSSLAKGFAADEISRLLTTTIIGAAEHLVQIGGDTRASVADRAELTDVVTTRPAWPLAVESADVTNRSPAVVIDLKGQALSTSGDYRNFFTANGKRYGHIIDPRTGRPATSSLAAVSVVHASCATSSALATALFVMGHEEAIRFAREHRIPCFLQIREGTNVTQRMTPEFAALISAPPR
jgi:thiamine biosynthesis lipoprotein